MQARAGASVAVIVYCQPFGSWTFDITVPSGAMLGTSGEAARQRYGQSVPKPDTSGKGQRESQKSQEHSAGSRKSA